MVAALVVALSNTFFVASADVSNGARLAMYSKPAVVRVIDGISGEYSLTTPDNQSHTFSVSHINAGSGVIVDASGYIATNAHLVNTTHDGEEKAKSLLQSELVSQVMATYKVPPPTSARAADDTLFSLLGQAMTINYIRNQSKLNWYKVYHHVIIGDGSVLPFEIKQYVESDDQGKDIAILKIDLKNAPILLFGDSDKLQLQEHVTQLGYSGAGDTFAIAALNSKSALEATLTEGQLSGRRVDQNSAPLLQVTAPATLGISGGPCLNDQSEVVGLLSLRSDTTKAEAAHDLLVVPANTISKYLKTSAVTNELGPVDKVYREGLDLYWSAKYKNAIPKFEEVQRLFPQHSEVGKLISSSQQGIADGKDKSDFGAGMVVGGLLVTVVFIGLVVVGSLILFLILRRRQPGLAHLYRHHSGASRPADLQIETPIALPAENEIGTTPADGLVFLCYARVDEEFALALAKAIKERGISVWVDQWNIEPSADWDRSIDHALYRCERLLIVLSPASVASEEVRAELRTALEEKKRVVPVLYQECELPRRLRLIQHFDFTDSRPDDDALLGRLVSSLTRSKS